MSEFSLEPEYVKLCSNILSNRVFKIKNDTKYYKMSTGISQGSGLGSLYFSLAINDIGKAISLPYLLYADDIVIYTHGKDVIELVKQLENNLREVDAWCKTNQLTVNFAKTEYMIFHKLRDPPKQFDYEMNVNGNIINRVYNYKYLGIRFDPSMMFSKQYDYVISKTSSSISFLRGIKRYIPPNVMKIMINCNVLSIANYCLKIWAVQTNLQLNAIQEKIDRFLVTYFLPSFYKKTRKFRKQKKSLTKCKINLNSIMLSNNLFTISERRDLYTLKYMFKLYQSRDLKMSESNNNKYRQMPLAKIPDRCSESFKSCVLWRGIKLWNALPSNWELENITFIKFLDLCKQFIIEKRDCQWI